MPPKMLQVVMTKEWKWVNLIICISYWARLTWFVATVTMWRCDRHMWFWEGISQFIGRRHRYGQAIFTSVWEDCQLGYLIPTPTFGDISTSGKKF